MELTVRSYTDQTRQYLLDGIQRIAKGQALSMGLPEEKWPRVIIHDNHTPALFNHSVLTRQAAQLMKRRIGDDRVVKVEPVLGGEDFARYGLVKPNIPSLFVWLGAVSPKEYTAAQKNGALLPSLHSPLFAPMPKPTIHTGVTAMSNIALALFQGDIDLD